MHKTQNLKVYADSLYREMISNEKKKYSKIIMLHLSWYMIFSLTKLINLPSFLEKNL